MVATCKSDCILRGRRLPPSQPCQVFPSASACLDGQHFQPVGTEIILVNVRALLHTARSPTLKIVDLESRS